MKLANHSYSFKEWNDYDWPVSKYGRYNFGVNCVNVLHQNNIKQLQNNY